MANVNKKLHKAKKEKNDEFYTQLVDIEKELEHYEHHFRDKIVYLNCDDVSSDFWKYFFLKFTDLGLKKLIATHFDKEKPSYKLETTDGENVTTTQLMCNGDFRSAESEVILIEADIVVSNPPFSLFKEYVSQLMQYGKEFLIVGNKNAVTYKEIFPLIKNNLVWLGVNRINWFVLPDNSLAEAPAFWYTNLLHGKRAEPLILYKEFNEAEFPTYDNYNAIEVSKTEKIPMDYQGVMGVPITFLNKYNPDQFEIIGSSESGGNTMPGVEEIRTTEKRSSPILNGKGLFKRIFIKRK